MPRVSSPVPGTRSTLNDWQLLLPGDGGLTFSCIPVHSGQFTIGMLILESEKKHIMKQRKVRTDRWRRWQMISGSKGQRDSCSVDTMVLGSGI